jgi:hypothetical protein
MYKIPPIFMNKYISSVNIRFILPIKKIYVKWQQEKKEDEYKVCSTGEDHIDPVIQWVPYFYLKNPKIDNIMERYMSFVFDRDTQEVCYFVFTKFVLNAIYKYINKYDFQYNTWNIKKQKKEGAYSHIVTKLEQDDAPHMWACGKTLINKYCPKKEDYDEILAKYAKLDVLNCIEFQQTFEDKEQERKKMDFDIVLD